LREEIEALQNKESGVGNLRKESGDHKRSLSDCDDRESHINRSEPALVRPRCDMSGGSTNPIQVGSMIESSSMEKGGHTGDNV
jgi:hypothetical protein